VFNHRPLLVLYLKGKRSMESTPSATDVHVQAERQTTSKNVMKRLLRKRFKNNSKGCLVIDIFCRNCKLGRRGANAT